jgi:hypothetical protein
MRIPAVAPSIGVRRWGAEGVKGLECTLLTLITTAITSPAPTAVMDLGDCVQMPRSANRMETESLLSAATQQMLLRH